MYLKTSTQTPITAERLAGLIIRITDDTISGKIAKKVLIIYGNSLLLQLMR
jgi:Asp-tRNA(Asn)/Glu-tRNA(Gln) amidotransferase B subunit